MVAADRHRGHEAVHALDWIGEGGAAEEGEPDAGPAAVTGGDGPGGAGPKRLPETTADRLTGCGPGLGRGEDQDGGGAKVATDSGAEADERAPGPALH